MASSLDKLRHGALTRGSAATARPRVSLNGRLDSKLMSSDAPPATLAGPAAAQAMPPAEAVASATGARPAGILVRLALEQLVEGQDNWRVFYDLRKLQELEAELRRDGQLEPVQAFRRADGKYELIGGNRRLRAARQVPLTHLLVHVIEEPATPQLRARLSRNLNAGRADTTVLDDAIRWRDALAGKVFASQGALAEFYGVPQSRASKTIAIAELPQVVLETVAAFMPWQKLGKLYPLSQLHALWTERGLDATGRVLKLVRDNENGLGEERLLQMVEELKGQPKTRAAGSRATPARVLLSCPAGGGGAVKLFEHEGKLELQVKGVPPETLKRLYAELSRTAQGVLDSAAAPASNRHVQAA